MFAFMSKDQTGTWTARTRDEDGMPNKTSVVPLAGGSPIHGHKDKPTAEELAKLRKYSNV